ncbi:MAG: ATP-dependent RecD-like DNA helicase [Candidatus Magnetoovum sp. WYHC-5]|nr:ATP-dependent RecD-like DNA helicase [Candidatus Magnetoovum sp. WYHC-5]
MVLLSKTQSKSDVELRGQVERVTYHNEENSYTVLKLKANGNPTLITVVGTLIGVTAGEVLKLMGSWVNHAKYGQQFQVSTYETVVPATVKGIERYLGSGLIKGIGHVFAKRLVEKFGADTLNIIENSIERLSEVDGIGTKRLSMIQTAWAQQRDIKDIMLFLHGYGVSTTYAIKIYKQYGKDSIKTVQLNPYRLATDIYGIGFLTADKIARTLGFDEGSELRAEAGILYVLHQLADEGHVYYPYEPLIAKCMDVLGMSREQIVKAFGTIAYEKKITIEDISTDDEVLINNKAVYLTKYYVCETSITENLMDLYTRSKTLRNFDHVKALLWVQKELNIKLHPMQEEAVRQSFDKKILIITGGPGTGKTTILNSIIKIYKQLGQRILLTAPTGRAAKRLSETTGLEAKTIHRLLDYSFKDGGFKKNDKNKLETDLVIVDECSMVDTILMHHFLKSVPAAATLILVGDVDQLPPVGAGFVLRDIINSERFPLVKLTEIFRQSKNSLIIVNAHKINHGEFPILIREVCLHTKDNKEAADFYFFEIEEPENIVKKIVELCTTRIPERFKLEPFKDIQVLTAMNRGTIGISSMNQALQQAMNTSKETLERGGRVFKVFDKVMQLVNNYDKDVFNGDIGRIIRINNELQELTVDFDKRHVVYDYNDLDELTLAYAISVHKAQGSEFPAIVMPIHTQHYIMLQRNLLYTGITRGKKLVVLVGTKRALYLAIKNDKQQLRYTHLKNRLKELNKK